MSTKEVKIAKEADDVLALVEAVIKTVKEKGEYTDLVDELVAAITGADQIAEEAKDVEALMNTVGLRVSSIANLFIGK